MQSNAANNTSSPDYTSTDYTRSSGRSADGKPGADSLSGKLGDALQEGRTGIQNAASRAGSEMSDEMAQIRRDMAEIQSTLAKFASTAGGEATKTAQSIGSAVAGEVGSAANQVVDAGARIAATATEQAKTFASELETMARRNPFGTLAGTLVVGVVIGMMSRGRA